MHKRSENIINDKMNKVNHSKIINDYAKTIL